MHRGKAHGAGSALCEALAVAVQVSERRHRGAEVVVVVEHAGEPAYRGRDLGVPLHRPIGLEVQDIHCAAVGGPDPVPRDATVVVHIRAHRQVDDAVA